MIVPRFFPAREVLIFAWRCHSHGRLRVWTHLGVTSSNPWSSGSWHNLVARCDGCRITRRCGGHCGGVHEHLLGCAPPYTRRHVLCGLSTSLETSAWCQAYPPASWGTSLHRDHNAARNRERL